MNTIESFVLGRFVKIHALACLLAAMLLVGCSGRGSFPHTSGTEVDLTRNNYKVVKSNAIGSSSGFYLLGFIPIVPARYTAAMSDLYESAGIEEGTAQALVNVTQENSYLYLILFGIPRLTVRADVIEFIDESPSPSSAYRNPPASQGNNNPYGRPPTNKPSYGGNSYGIPSYNQKGYYGGSD